MKRAGRSRAALVLGLALAGGVAPRRARAEEGLFVTRVSGGAVMEVESKDLSGAVGGSADLSLTERWGLVSSTLFATSAARSSLRFGFGVQALVGEWFWRRVFIHASPELQVTWAPDRHRALELGLRVGLGYEELLVWGTGLVVEVFGAAPLTGDLRGLDALQVGATAGLFMEF